MKFNGFNGQAHRHAIFAELLSKCRFDAIIETGACNGETSGYMAEVSGLPVLTCEIDPKWHAEAVERTKGFGVLVENDDSREMLKTLAASAFLIRRPCFYLDAHWGEELPLAEEVETILSNWRSYVIMIDDFQVPGDAGYGFDDYGGEKKIRRELIVASLDKHGPGVFFPKEPSSTETGARRGSCFLASPWEMTDLLGTCAGLTRV